MVFDWDEDKGELNRIKHGVTFDEATSVFDDYFHVDFYDPKHSAEEHRFMKVGESNEGRLLIVSYTERGDKIRIISARELTPQERRMYEHGKFE
ncbi:MAG TPA: BrnT family toxin [Pyrinomonadaceae bacterium]|nr:BrnT family toxin [Pyrinomonadaceae bacterium]